MAKIIADLLGGELDVVLVRKLGHPSQPELAIGAIVWLLPPYAWRTPNRFPRKKKLLSKNGR